MGTFRNAILRGIAFAWLLVSLGCAHAQQPTGSIITVTPKADASATGELRFREKIANGSNYVGLNAPASIAANKVWTWPGSDSANALCSDGSLALTFTCAAISLFPVPDSGLTVWESDAGNVAGAMRANNTRGTFSLYNAGTRSIYLNGGTGEDSFINTSANLGIGTNAPIAGATVHIAGDNARAIVVDTYGIATLPGMYVSRSNGTSASPTKVLNGDNLAIFGAGGYDTATLLRAQGRLYFQAEGDWSTTSTPIRMIVSTVATGSASVTDRWSFESNGDLIPMLNNSYVFGSYGSRVANIVSTDEDLRGTLTFSNSSGNNATFANPSGGSGGLSNADFTGLSIRPSSDGGANLGSSTRRWLTLWTQLQDISSTMTFSNGSGNVTIDNVAGTLEFTGSTKFNSLAQFGAGARLLSGQSLTTAGSSNIGASGSHFSTAWIDAFVFNGNTGLSATVTVRNAAGSGTCTLVFTVGGYTGGTC